MKYTVEELAPMIEEPRILEMASQMTACICLAVTLAEMKKEIGPALQEVHSAIREQGIAVTGPWFTHHFRRPAETFDFAVCVPTAKAIGRAGRVQAYELPASTVLRTVYLGSYERLAKAWGEFNAWIAARELTCGPDLWECYVAGPESSPDPNQWVTELSRPLVNARP